MSSNSVAYWSPVEDATLRKAYASGGIEEAVAAIPGRSRSAIFHRATRLGLKRRRRWTSDDDQELRSLWGTMSLASLAKVIKRTQITIYWRAHKLGLERGCPQGYEYLAAAAERSGYTTGQLTRIMRAAGMRPMRSLSRPCKGGHRMHVVDPLDVDDAVRAWHATETIEQAAKARGLVGETLRAWLVAARARGVKIPPQPSGAKRRHWRVSSATIDQVIAWQSERESLTAAAIRTGVKRWRLRMWIEQARVDLGRAKPMQLLKTDIDRVVSERLQREEFRHAGYVAERMAPLLAQQNLFEAAR